MKTKEWGKEPFIIQNGDRQAFTIVECGRVSWALQCLMAAGENGCTPIDTPGPRWSDYVFRLRGKGVDIETITQPHGGPFKGTHARYVLRSQVERITGEDAA